MLYSNGSKRHLKRKTIKIFGPPGTGKTTTLLDRLEKWFDKGVLPREVAYLSFTNKAVDEARNRANKKFPDCNDEDLGNFRTIHSFCRKFRKQVPVIDPEIDMVEFAQNLGMAKPAYENYDGVRVFNDWSLRVYDKSRNKLITPEQQFVSETFKRATLPRFKLIYQQYELFKEDHRVDFTDMITHFIEHESSPHLKILIVDEAQDLTPLQWKMIYKIAENSDRVYIAGDDDQAIFEWNGANVIDYINFPGRDYVLTQSHRLPKIVHNFSTHISDMIKPRVVKKFLPSDKHGEILTHPRFSNLVDAVNTLPGSWIILGRTQEIVRELEDHARQSGLFFKNTKGKTSFDLNKWNAIKYWNKLMNNGLVNKEQAGIVYAYVNEIAFGWRSIESKRWMNIDSSKEMSIDFLRTFGGLTANPGPWQQVFNRNFPEKDKMYFEKVLEAGVDLDMSSRVTIDTIHSIKGGEAQNVCVYEKANWPAHFGHKVGLARSSEARVWYVGVTRAQETLHILRTHHEYFFPLARLYNQFIKENYGRG
jgi:DNA helicase-2/ATP-dependent DNA helicase PcrA